MERSTQAGSGVGAVRFHEAVRVGVVVGLAAPAHRAEEALGGRGQGFVTRWRARAKDVSPAGDDLSDAAPAMLWAEAEDRRPSRKRNRQRHLVPDDGEAPSQSPERVRVMLSRSVIT